ncbi:hypothetical protein LTR94_026922 [Friedmanniomyces endolithicus]|nr:hypothetical protein LTR94_026922 [Friedmanniomyces endolithicus]
MRRLTLEELAILRKAMSAHAGVVRTASGLTGLIGQIDAMIDDGGAAACLLAARLIAQAALARCESRGGHYRSDCPWTEETAIHSQVRIGAEQMLEAADRADGTAAGLDCIGLAVRALDPGADIKMEARDADAISAGQVLATVEADARAFLSAERTALNLVGRLCGIASLTQDYVRAVEGFKARIADTRKTTPGLRALEKHAVACGGGINHRFGLDDAILIKDNHVAVCGGVQEAVRRARAFAPHLMKVEVEVDGLDQLDAVLALIPEGAAPDVVMLDNFSLADLRQAVDRVEGRILIEASGGVDLTTVRAIAETGVDVISVGALTHSAKVLDIGLDAI